MNIWLLRFEDFVLFLKEKKRHPKTDSKNKEERSLAMWVIAQRFKYRNSKLNQEKIKNLESIECWKWDPNEEAWKKNFNDIIEFIENNKYYPSTNYKTPEEGFLGRWVSVQRKLYKQSKLDQQKVAKLESLSGWTWDVHEENWQKHFIELTDFLNKHKTYPKERSKNKDETFLSMWVSNQKVSYKNKNLQENRASQLESLPNWMWYVHEENWGKNFMLLICFIDENKRYPRSYSNNEEEAFLGRWIRTQKTSYKKFNIESEKITQLESLAGWMWDAREETWDKNFRNIRYFLGRNERYPKERSKNKDEKSLGKWIAAQRVAYNKSNLDKERVDQLESLAGWMWDVIEEAWEKNFRNLLEFIDKNKVYPRSSSKNLRERFLARWFLKQRKEYKNKNLQQKMICKLESIPNWMWNCCK